jgi:hypothetical protein
MRMMRIAAVTAGLIVAGAVFGTIAGAVILLAWLAATGSFTSPLDDAAFVLQFSFAFAGTLGAVLGPIAGWLLMRHVPLGLAVGGTTLGTVVGGAIGFIATALPIGSMVYGVAGFGVCAIALRILYPRREPRRLRH